tara:strand:- start:119 stop:424 length:306 start_codon:yes stop_codon:yes gene_type:complete
MGFTTWRKCLQKAHKVYVYNNRHDHHFGLYFPVSKKDVFNIMKQHEETFDNKKDIIGNFHTFPKEIIKFKKVDGEYKDVAVEVYDLCINIGNSLWGLELKE